MNYGVVTKSGSLYIINDSDMTWKQVQKKFVRCKPEQCGRLVKWPDPKVGESMEMQNECFHPPNTAIIMKTTKVESVTELDREAFRAGDTVKLRWGDTRLYWLESISTSDQGFIRPKNGNPNIAGRWVSLDLIKKIR